MRLGCDPEIFLVDAAEALVSAIDRIGGSKSMPRPLPIGDGFAVQEDNVALEFNIPPANSAGEYIEHINRVKAFLLNEVQQQGLQFSNLSAAIWPQDQLVDPRAREFGCDPDYNAWTDGKRNPKPKAANKQLRSCGGHVHVGHEFPNREAALRFIKYMDLYLGVPSTLMDTGEMRKELYGKCGAFRPKEYGVEYRVLSNYWVFKDELIEWVWNQTQLALLHSADDSHGIADLKKPIHLAINENNKQVAFDLITNFGIQTQNAIY